MPMRNIRVTVEGQAPRFISTHTPAMAVLPEKAADGLTVIGALVNNEAVSLSYPLLVNCDVSPLTLGSSHGWRIYRWSLSFILAKSVNEVFPEAVFRVRHSIGGGLYCTIQWPGQTGGVTVRHLEQIGAAMRRIVAQDLPLDPVRASYEDALRLFAEAGLVDKLNLLRHRNPPQVLLVNCGGFLDLLQEPMVHRTGLLSNFALVPYEPGFVLMTPPREHPQTLRPMEPQPHLFRIYEEHIAWGRILGVTTVGELNQTIQEKRIDEFIRTAEALHDKKLAHIAEQITARHPRVRLVLIAGPSSAGKTTFAKRLVTHLRVNGLRPVMISTDDYFVGDERNPRDASGALDYEHIESMDLRRLNADLEDLLAGREVHLPLFDFIAKRGHDRPETTQLGPDDVIVMEGIHSLNPRLTEQIPRAAKFLIYISALTQLSIDRSTRISTTDNRLLRRMVRDNQFRGRAALPTLQRWPSVRAGEQRWIFPYQHLADATFNSALDYEMAVLKPFAVALLNEVKPTHPEYAEARRLTGFLHNFMSLPPDAVPGNSILREYIGGSQLHY